MRQDTVRGAHAPAEPAVSVPRQRRSYGEPGRSAEVADRRARRALALPVVLCGTALLAGAATLGAVAVGSTEHSRHHFEVPGRSGDLVRDADAESGVAARVAQAEQSFSTRFGDRLASVSSGAYRNTAPAAGRPVGSLVFVGAAIDTDGDPADFVTALGRGGVKAGYRTRSVAAGSGARGACLESDAGAALCAWSTGDSVGELIPTVPGWTTSDLAAAMRILRSDAEKRR